MMMQPNKRKMIRYGLLPHQDKTGAKWTARITTQILHGKLQTDDEHHQTTSTDSPATTGTQPDSTTSHERLTEHFDVTS